MFLEYSVLVGAIVVGLVLFYGIIAIHVSLTRSQKNAIIPIRTYFTLPVG